MIAIIFGIRFQISESGNIFNTFYRYQTPYNLVSAPSFDGFDANRFNFKYSRIDVNT